MNLFKGASIYAFGNLFSKAVYFFVVPVVVSKIGAYQYGIFSSIETLYTLLPIFMTFALETGVYRMYYDYADNTARRRYLGTIAMSVFGFSCAVSVLLLLIPSASSWLFPNIPFNPYFRIGICISFLNALISVPKVILQVEERAAAFSILTISQAVVTIPLILIFVLRYDLGTIGYLQAVFLSNVAVLVFSFHLVRKSIDTRWDMTGLFRSLSFSLPVLPSLIFSWILNASDRAFLSRYFTTDDVGVYSLGWKYATLGSLAITSINTAFSPLFYKEVNSNLDHSKANVTKLIELAMLVMISIVFLNSVVGVSAIRLFSKSEFVNSEIVIMQICYASLFSIFGFVSNLQFYQMKQSYFPMIFVFGAGILSMGLNSVLVPLLGIFGPPFSLLFVNIFLWIVPTYVAQRNFYLPLRWKNVLLFSAVAICTRLVTFKFANSYMGDAVCCVVTIGLIVWIYKLHKQGGIINAI